ncbi:ChrR family anti-sigma-E factor [Acidovorax sp. SUPP3334]|uniref:ChrR family anti-sigma-E factor n=1 Tax=Acidovorax sp. SUPP3334 TaxID=2920881 RepID=UPI0023DE2F06|nr:ChrR family anti-sigma-E factor [Acidovorax sp. SUPP3334]GKT25837.1 ChrR family anti-sigma-E factor [Acidovorax sp. SUPP3334]
MTIQHHPADEVLLAQAAGHLSAAASLLVRTHVDMCAHCRERLCTLDMVGGVLLEGMAPAMLQPDALARTLAVLDGPDRHARPRPGPVRGGSSRPAGWPEGAFWPGALDACKVSPWHWLGPGVRWSRVTVPGDADANVLLLRIGAGKRLPQHTHSDVEWTQVLHGAFHDGRALFGPGDFDGADTQVHHQPVVEAGGECICLAGIEGRVLFDGAMARWVGALVGM